MSRAVSLFHDNAVDSLPVQLKWDWVTWAEDNPNPRSDNREEWGKMDEVMTSGESGFCDTEMVLGVISLADLF